MITNFSQVCDSQEYVIDTPIELSTKGIAIYYFGGPDFEKIVKVSLFFIEYNVFRDAFSRW